MKVLISGATGFVGLNLIPALIEDGKIEKIGIIIRSSSVVLPFFYHQKCEIILMEDGFKSSIKKFNPEVVIHLASYLTSASDEEAINRLMDANIIFGAHLLDALKDTQLKLFINTGSFSEYHFDTNQYNPTYLYAATKHAFRDIIKYYSELGQFKTVHVIPYTIYGGIEPKKKIIDILIEALDAETPTELSSGVQKLDFIHIDDVVQFYKNLVLSLHQIENDEVLYLGTGKPLAIRELGEVLENLTNKKLNVAWGARKDRERDTTVAVSPVSSYKKFLWQPLISIEEGLAKLLSLKQII